MPISINCRPFLRWAGGKQWLIKYLDGRLDISSFTSYHEPFVGGGTIFWAKNPAQKQYINDFDIKITNLYNVIKNNYEE